MANLSVFNQSASAQPSSLGGSGLNWPTALLLAVLIASYFYYLAKRPVKKKERNARPQNSALAGVVVFALLVTVSGALVYFGVIPEGMIDKFMYVAVFLALVVAVMVVKANPGLTEKTYFQLFDIAQNVVYLPEHSGGLGCGIVRKYNPGVTQYYHKYIGVGGSDERLCLFMFRVEHYGEAVLAVVAVGARSGNIEMKNAYPTELDLSLLKGVKFKSMVDLDRWLMEQSVKSSMAGGSGE